MTTARVRGRLWGHVPADEQDAEGLLTGLRQLLGAVVGQAVGDAVAGDQVARAWLCEVAGREVELAELAVHLRAGYRRDGRNGRGGQDGQDGGRGERLGRRPV